METKKDIRKKILRKRMNMSIKKWSDNGQQVMETLLNHPLFLAADEIYCYADCKREVYTSDVFITAWKMGKKTAVPRIEGDEMEFFYIDCFADLDLGTFGIPEPVTTEMADGKNVLVIIPGIAFDKNRNRIGYGKGFYDKYLKKHPDYRSIAVAYSIQVLDTIPADIHDVKPEILITEEHIYE